MPQVIPLSPRAADIVRLQDETRSLIKDCKASVAVYRAACERMRATVELLRQRLLAQAAGH